MRSDAASRAGRYVAVKGRRRIRQSFGKEFWEEVHALRADVGRLGTHYVRHAGVWLALGVFWWIAFVVILLILGASLSDALEATLEITFGITAPTTAVKTALGLTGAATPAARIAGSIGWTVIIAFTMLIPALIALMLERLPNLVVTVRGLMDPEAWDFFSKYSTVLGRYLSAVSRSSTSPQPSRVALRETRADAIATIAELVTFWYREEVELNANASFMRLVPGSASSTRDLRPLYGNGVTVADSQWVLELTDWGVPSGDLPTDLVLFVDDERPRPGAPYAVVKNKVDGITNVLDRSEWRRHGSTESETDEAVAYFRSVPFRSFVSIPVFDVSPSDRPIGALSIQVDRPNVFVIGKSETDDLVALIQRLCYFLAWLERMERDGDTNR